MDTEKVGRRALIRRAATLAAAGIGGVAATEMLSASPASATTGAMQYGQAQDAGASDTTLTSNATNGATLVLGHTNGLTPLRLQDSGDSASFADSGGKLLGGELVNLTETVPSGAGTATVDTLFWMAGDDADSQLENLAVVLTTATGTVFAPVGPTRVLDTRSTALRTLLVSQAVLDSSHRLIGGKTLELQLDGFVDFAYAVHFNITAVTPTGPGFLTAFGSQTGTGTPAKPNASNLNYTTNVTIANHGVSPLTDRLSLFIYASKTTHVVVDVQGWTLPDFSFLVSSPAKAKGALRAGTNSLGVVRRPMPRRKTGA
jgi:hypothetical protein